MLEAVAYMDIVQLDEDGTEIQLSVETIRYKSMNMYGLVTLDTHDNLV